MFILSVFYVFAVLMIVAGVIMSFLLARQIQREERKNELTKDSVIAISGACTGIGLMLAIKLATEHKCHIVIYDSAKNNPEALIREIEDVGAKGHFFDCDMLNKDKMFHAIAMTLAELQKIDIFIHTGGAVLEKAFEDYTDDEIKDIMQVNFMGPATMIKEVLTIMKRQGKGQIVNVPYEAEKLYSDDVFAYCGAKTGLNRLLRGVQKDLERVECDVSVTIVRSLFFCCDTDEVNTAVKWSDMKAYMEKIYDGILLRKKEV